MQKMNESYKIGNIEVTVSETENPEKLKIYAVSDGREFNIIARKYEYQNYTRLMNQKIVRFFKEAEKK